MAKPKQQLNMWGQAEELATQMGMPWSSDAERAIIGIVLDSGGKFAELQPLLSQECFLSPAHRYLWNAFTELSDAGKRIDMVTVADHVVTKRDQDKIGGIQSLMAYGSAVPFFGEYSTYVDILREKLARRKIIERSAEAARAALLSDDKPEDIAARLSTSITDTGSAAISRGAEDIAGIVREAGGPDSYFTGDSGVLIPSPWRKINSMIRGFKPGQFIAVGARPGQGKSVFGLQCGSFFARKYGKRVVLFSMEMSKKELLDRLVAGYAKVPLEQVESGAAWNNPPLRREMSRVLMAMNSLSLRIVELETPTMPAILAWVKRASVAGWTPDVMIIDYLQLMRGSGGRTENRQQEVSDITRSIKLASRKFNMLSIALCQLSRAGAARGRGPDAWRPELSDLRESGAIEQDADKVAFIHRPEMYEREKPELKGKAEIIFAKNRAGQTGIRTLDFRGEMSFFYDGADDDDGSPVITSSALSTVDQAETRQERLITV